MIRNCKSLVRTFCQANKKPEVQANHFGFKNVSTEQKQPLVDQVFHSVANKYDAMNDFMSLGVHRWWKNYFVNELGNLTPKNYFPKSRGQDKVRVLDVAGGTGDIAFKILESHGFQNVKITVLDINQSMLDQGMKRAENMGLTNDQIEFVCANAEQLPLGQSQFDAYTISFGLRNVPRTKKALAEAHRVLKSGGRFMCLEFSKVQNPVFKEIYRQYSFSVIPKLGQIVTNDRDSYQYLVESIEKFYTQDQLVGLMNQVGFECASYENLTDGIVAIHSGFKLDLKQNQ